MKTAKHHSWWAKVLIMRKCGSWADGYYDALSYATVFAVEKNNVEIIWDNDNKEDKVDIDKCWRLPENHPTMGMQGKKWDFSQGEIPRHVDVQKSGKNVKHHFVEQDDGSLALRLDSEECLALGMGKTLGEVNTSPSTSPSTSTSPSPSPSGREERLHHQHGH